MNTLLSGTIRKLKISVIWLCVLLPNFAGNLTADEPIISIFDSSSYFYPEYSKLGMVVSQEIIASNVGSKILHDGGNAIDAAVATGFALAVTLPRAGNLGGGGFMMVYLADQNKTISIDYREMAPAAAYAGMFLDSVGEVDTDMSRFGVKSSGVPGSVAGLIHAQKNYGKLKLSEVIAPAIELANGGFLISPELEYSLSARSGRLKRNASSRKYFFKEDGSNYSAGEFFFQPDLGATLKRISKDGHRGFYEGKTASLIAESMTHSGGLITLKDLQNYRVVEREPVCGSYRSSKICAMPPPSSGGVHLIQMLNILEGWDLQELGHNSAEYIHRLVEVMRHAYADRSKYLGDPDFFPVPIDQIIDKSYAAKLRSNISLTRATISSDIEPGLSINLEDLIRFREKKIDETSETTHVSTWDKWGNVVSNTTTLNFSYGNGRSVAGAGFLMNNEMDDFSAKNGASNAYGLIGGAANAIEPGKRPLSSMTPAIVFDSSGKPMLATGSPGGGTIITVVLQIILNVLDFKMNIAEASSVARIHHQWQPDKLFYESGVSIDTLNLLKTMGHTIDKKTRRLGAVQSIQRSQAIGVFGASDPRRAGSGAIAQ